MRVVGNEITRAVLHVMKLDSHNLHSNVVAVWDVERVKLGALSKAIASVPGARYFRVSDLCVIPFHQKVYECSKHQAQNDTSNRRVNVLVEQHQD